MKKPRNSKRKPQFISRIMAEMFARVGRTFSPEACTKSDWYLENTWTWEQQADFQEWLAGQFWRRGYTNQKANYQAGMFILFFGWKVDPQAPLTARQKRGNPARGRKLLAEIQQRGSRKKRRAAALERLAVLGITAKNLSVATRDIEQLCDEMESGELVEPRLREALIEPAEATSRRQFKKPWPPSRAVSRHENLQNHSHPPMVVVVPGPSNG